MTKLTESESKDLVYSAVETESFDFQENDVTPRYFVEEASQVAAESLCGIDERQKVVATTVMPYKAICKLYMKSPTGRNYIGTGWLTHKNKLYTAGHCVFDRDAGAWMSSIIVVPGKSGLLEPYGRYFATELVATRGWIESGSHRYDMGAIKLSSEVGHGEVLVPTLSDPDSGSVCGYPADRDTGIFQYKMNDVLTKNGGQFKYMLDTFGGQSGSPLLKDRVKAVGTHNYGGCPNSASDLYEEFVAGVNAW